MFKVVCFSFGHSPGLDAHGQLLDHDTYLMQSVFSIRQNLDIKVNVSFSCTNSLAY